MPEPSEWARQEAERLLSSRCSAGGSAYCQDCATCRKDRDAIARALDAARAGEARLRAAIELHRHNVWGDGTVGHDEDAALYAALGEK